MEVRLDCDAPPAQLFWPLLRAEARSGAAPIVLPCQLCALLAAWRAAPPNRSFVVLDLLVFPESDGRRGLLDGGSSEYGRSAYGCRDEPRAVASACKLARLLRRRCPAVRVNDVVAMLDSPWLVAWSSQRVGAAVQAALPRPARPPLLRSHPRELRLPISSLVLQSNEAPLGRKL